MTPYSGDSLANFRHGETQRLLFIRLFMQQFTGNFTFTHHNNAVGDAQHLRQIAGGEQDRHTAFCQFIDDVIDFVFRPTSIPRVGSSSKMTFISSDSQRPRMAFC